MLALTGSVPAQRIERLQRTNLLAGRKATFSVAPNCSHCRGGDETDLTDGKFWQSGSSTDFWAHEGAVGWEFGSLPGVMIRFDLGQVQPIRTLGFDTVSGRAGVTFPAAVLAYVSDDGRTWHYVTDLINEALPESRFIRRRFVAGDHVTGGLRTRGRHLAFYIVRGAGSTFVDEIEVLRGNRDPSEAVLESDGIATDQLEDNALNRARSTGRETGSLAHLSAWFRNYYATLVQNQKPVEERRMDRLERYVAIDNKGNWPNLTLMPDGSIVATVFSEPSHGLWGGSPECWISRDNGRTWTRTEMKVPHEMHYLIPYGNIVELPGGRLAISCYSHDPNDISRNTAWVFFSDDDGRTWGNARMIAADSYNETALLPLDDGKLLALSRTIKWGKKQDEHLESFVSDDGGQTWKFRGPVSLPREIPANLLRLQDGSILLTYGSRLRGALGVHARISRDEGLTWDAPRVLFNVSAHASHSGRGGVDGGYPSSVQLSDGTLVTAYYCSRIPGHQRYHMGVVFWED